MENKTALLIMDMQMGILSRMPEQGTELITKVAAVIETAREKGIHVIFVRLGFQKGLPELNPANQRFYANKEIINANLEMFMQIPTTLGIKNNDIIVNKKRVSAFAGSDLEMILRANSISHLLLTGISTSGIVLSTLREAADKDYQITVLSDACFDPDPETHQFLIEKIFPKQAEVTSIDAWKSRVL